MARKIALYSWCAAFGITVIGILVSMVADVEGGPLLLIAMFISAGAFALAIGATIAWVLSGVRDLTKDRPKNRPFSE